MNQVTKIRGNSWSNSLCALMPLWICPFSSTNVEDSLQINLFMQNKPNFRKSQMNANSLVTKDYENISDWTLGQNKPNSNPNKANFQKAKMNASSFITKDYRKKDDFSVRINKPNFRNGQNDRKLNFNNGLQKKRFFRSPKTNPIQTQFLGIPAGVYPAQSLPRTSMRGCGAVMTMLEDNA